MLGKRQERVDYFEGGATITIWNVGARFNFAGVPDGLPDGGRQGLPVAETISKVIG
ncbi:MAG: hypothetical protein M3362_01795 [Acidobacteriota bacterium]|nr:hypothetical protein [Acidobacteriota bacterium]